MSNFCLKNNYNFKIFVNWADITQKEKAKEILKGISDITYMYFLTASKQNPARQYITDEATGEVLREEYLEKWRYLYTDSFKKKDVAKDLKISRPTLDAHIKQLIDIGLIVEELEMKNGKEVMVWKFPHVKVSDFIPADTANFFTHLCKYHNKYVKGDQYKNIIRLLFDLKRIDCLSCESSHFSITQLLSDLGLSDVKENRLRILDYLILLQGLDLIRFSSREIQRGSVKEKYLQLDYFNDTYNSKMDLMKEELDKCEQMNTFMNEQKFSIAFDSKKLEF